MPENSADDGTAGMRAPRAERNTVRTGHDLKSSPHPVLPGDGIRGEPAPPSCVRSMHGSPKAHPEQQKNGAGRALGSERSPQRRSQVDDDRMNFDHEAGHASSSREGEPPGCEGSVQRGEPQRAARDGREVSSAQKVPRVAPPASKRDRREQEDGGVASKRLRSGELTTRTRGRRDHEWESGGSPQHSEGRREDSAARCGQGEDSVERRSHRQDSEGRRERREGSADQRGRAEDNVERRGRREDSEDRRGHPSPPRDKRPRGHSSTSSPRRDPARAAERTYSRDTDWEWRRGARGARETDRGREAGSARDRRGNRDAESPNRRARDRGGRRADSPGPRLRSRDREGGRDREREGDRGGGRERERERERGGRLERRPERRPRDCSRSHSRDREARREAKRQQRAEEEAERERKAAEAAEREARRAEEARLAMDELARAYVVRPRGPFCMICAYTESGTHLPL
jgi:hypothetical protein